MHRTFLKNSLLLILCALASLLSAKETPWKASNRIAISSDGNPNADPDDIGATPFTLAVLVGRSGGYRLDKIHLFKEGVEGFQDDIQKTTPVLPGS